MSGVISIYLDLVRFLAAMGVFLWHAEQYPVSSGILPHIYFNHMLVIVFFVISGFVIASSASRPDKSLANYSADRLARLSSVVIPALALTYCLDTIGSWASPFVYSSISHQWQSFRLLVNLLYCQQIWFFCVNPSSNKPFWSLGYEFWYYVLFGIWIFVRSKRVKVLSLLAVSVFVGPKIMLLLPAWVVGALAFHLSKVCRCSYKCSLMLFVATGLGMVMALAFQDQLGLNNGKAGMPPLYYSSNFYGDNVFAVMVAAHFLCCALFSKHFTKSLEAYGIVKFIRWMASHTFSLYVYHLPILLFIRSIANYNPRNPFAVLAVIFTALLVIAGLSKITEERYPALRAILRRWMAILSSKSRMISNKYRLSTCPQKT
jgi:peptidoglycan/LPS O-acetylase OafA/YrhL